MRAICKNDYIVWITHKNFKYVSHTPNSYREGDICEAIINKDGYEIKNVSVDQPLIWILREEFYEDFETIQERRIRIINQL